MLRSHVRPVQPELPTRLSPRSPHAHVAPWPGRSSGGAEGSVLRADLAGVVGVPRVGVRHGPTIVPIRSSRLDHGIRPVDPALPSHGHRSARHRGCRPHHRRPARRARAPRGRSAPVTLPRPPTGGVRGLGGRSAWSQPSHLRATPRPAPSWSSTRPAVTPRSPCSIGRSGQPGRQGGARRHQRARLLRRLPAHLFGQGHRLAGRADPAAHPRARVVKALNTMNASYGRPRSCRADHGLRVRRRRDAKATVTGLLEDSAPDVIDLGDITLPAARDVPAAWLRLMGTLGTRHLQHEGRALSVSPPG